VIDAAGVGNGAAVGYHFGSKEGLWTAVLGRHLDPVVTALRAALDDFAARPEVPDLREALAAYVRPIVRLHRGERSELATRLLGYQVAEPGDAPHRVAFGDAEQVLRDFLELFGRVVPGVPPAERAWRFSAMNGVLIAYLLGLMDGVAGDGDENAACERLVAHLGTVWLDASSAGWPR
jgi:AcrR family transcriptional regulator